MLCITFDNFGSAAGEQLPWGCPADVPSAEWDAYNRLGLELGHPRILKLLADLVRLRLRCIILRLVGGGASSVRVDERS